LSGTHTLDHPVLDHSVRLDAGAVRILDRRVFPHEEQWVEARTVDEVAVAIAEMVTDGAGSLYAALAGMVLVARQHSAHRPGYLLAALRQAASRLTAARPTNNLVRDGMTDLMADLRELIDRGGTAAIVARVEDSAARLDRRYRERARTVGRHAASILADGAGVLTYGWLDTHLMALVRASGEAGKTFRYVVAETRPYLQGARLTAHTLAEMGQPVTLISDGMIATVLGPLSTIGRISALLTAADRVCMDGHVVHTVGVLGAATAAHAADVPYYVLANAPDRRAPTAADVVMEERDGDEVLSALGRRTASPLVHSGYYPAFDIVLPQFVHRVVTDQGALAPKELISYVEPAGQPMARPADRAARA
jgi:methylthioribose-1-phosphate isomerase